MQVEIRIKSMPSPTAMSALSALEPSLVTTFRCQKRRKCSASALSLPHSLTREHLCLAGVRATLATLPNGQTVCHDSLGAMDKAFERVSKLGGPV